MCATLAAFEQPTGAASPDGGESEVTATIAQAGAMSTVRAS